MNARKVCAAPVLARLLAASAPAARFELNQISAVSAQGEFRFMTVEGRVNAGVFIDFIKRLVHNAHRSIFFIVDGQPSCKAKKVQRYIESLDGWLELFFLSPYSPDSIRMSAPGTI
jgi:transposase